MNVINRLFFPLFILFGIITALVFILKDFLTNHNINTHVLLAANSLFLVINIIVFLFQKKALGHTNPNVFVRSVIAGMMVKMFACAIAVIIYVLSMDGDYNKKSVFIALFIYLIYLAAEVAILMRQNSRKNA